jgi:hypothetical protein
LVKKKIMSLKSAVRWVGLAMAWCAIPAMAQAQAETHANLQAVTATGASACNGTLPFIIRGGALV